MSAIGWPELRFPPINLWVVATLPAADASAGRQQRPAAASGKPTLHHLSKDREGRPDACLLMQRLLAARG